MACTTKLCWATLVAPSKIKNKTMMVLMTRPVQTAPFELPDLLDDMNSSYL
jgi:hypothetical protein